MTYKELLELAANAAGIEHEGWVEDYDDGRGGTGPGLLTWSPTTGVYVWNPLTDDGDALRLAVKLGMNIDVGVNPVGFTATAVIADYNSVFVDEYHEENSMKATRRAITRAAAEIGVNMNALPDVNQGLNQR